MTMQDAIELETKCDKLMTKCLSEYTYREPCSVSMTLNGRLKVAFDSNYVTIDMRTKEVTYVRYCGFYDDLMSIIELAIKCVNDNEDSFEKLMWSYDHRRELE